MPSVAEAPSRLSVPSVAETVSGVPVPSVAETASGVPVPSVAEASSDVPAASDAETHTGAGARPPAGRWVVRSVGSGVPVVLGVVALVAVVAGARDVAADRHARRAADALAEGDATAAVAEAGAAVRLRPDVVRLHLLDARARVADGQGVLAGLDAVDRALDVSPGDPIVVRARARLLVARADATRVPELIDLARSELDDLLAEDPLDGEVWALAAAAARLDGDADAAARAQERADDLSPGDPGGT